MGFRRVLQRIGLVHFDLHRTRFDDVEQLLGHRDEVFALGSIGVERRTGDVERALAGEQAEIERLDRAGGLPEQRGNAERGEAIERPPRKRGIFIDDADPSEAAGSEE